LYPDNAIVTRAADVGGDEQDGDGGEDAEGAGNDNNTSANPNNASGAAPSDGGEQQQEDDESSEANLPYFAPDRDAAAKMKYAAIPANQETEADKPPKKAMAPVQLPIRNDNLALMAFIFAAEIAVAGDVPGVKVDNGGEYLLTIGPSGNATIWKKDKPTWTGNVAQDFVGLHVATVYDATLQIKPSGARFEMKVLNVDIPGVPAAQKAQAAAQLAGFKGLTAQFDVSKKGELGELDFKADERLQQMQAAEVVLQSLQSAIELVAAPFPSEPIGVGAKWERKIERKQRGMDQSTKHTFTLKEATADSAVVTSEIEVAVPKHALQQRGAPPGTTEEVKGKGAYTYNLRFDRISSKVDGELQINRHVEAPDAKGGKQVLNDIVRLKNVLESPKEGAGGSAASGAGAGKDAK